MSLRTHLLALPALATAVNYSFDEDYCVVAGQTADGKLVLCTCADPRYLVPGGIDGIPWCPDLGHRGGRFDFTFPVPVAFVIVATTGTQAPVPQALYAAPPPVEVEDPVIILVGDTGIRNALNEPNFSEVQINLGYSGNVPGKCPATAFLKYSTFNSPAQRINFFTNLCQGLSFAAAQAKMGADYFRETSFLAG